MNVYIRTLLIMTHDLHVYVHMFGVYSVYKKYKKQIVFGVWDCMGFFLCAFWGTELDAKRGPNHFLVHSLFLA